MIFQNANPVTLFQGDPNAAICFVSGVPSWEGQPLSEVCKNMLLDLARKAGIQPNEVSFAVVLSEIPLGRKVSSVNPALLFDYQVEACQRLVKLGAKVFVPLGNFALETLTGLKSIDKWHLSVIPGTNILNRKCLPLYHPEQIFASYKDMPFLLFGMQKLREEKLTSTITTVGRRAITNPSFDQTMEFLNRAYKQPELSIDIETAHGQISCVGIATSPVLAISIPTYPNQMSEALFYKLWQKIGWVLAGPSGKIFQNFMYDCSYFSKYGFEVKNLLHDTMLAQKFLYPELPMGLDTIARIYTREPYWKDEGKEWKDVKDYNQFWLYNCKDALVTMEAAYEQIKQLKARGLDEAFKRLVMDCATPATEMCWRGLPVDADARKKLTSDTLTEIADCNGRLDELVTQALGKPINAKSPKQVKDYLKHKGYRLAVKKGKETSDVTALLKLQQKYPADQSLGLLLALSEKNKFMSSYLKAEPYLDGRMRFGLNIHGTETGRWSCRKDAWNNGINAQTISGNLKSMFICHPGWLFVECDLKQADSRFVAWDAPEPTLIDFYNRNIDIHRYVAARPELFNKPIDQITKEERQLGKTVGHASNYGMRGTRLSDICLLNMNLVLNPLKADAMLEGYHRVFPGIRMWQKRIESEVKRSKKLTTPLGRERFFFDRLGDDLYRVAYAYRPQSTVVDIVNTLMRHVAKQRNPEKLHFALQVHDSLVMLVHESYLDQALTIIKAESEWNPKLALSGGILQIPIEIKVGQCWGAAKVIYG